MGPVVGCDPMRRHLGSCLALVLALVLPALAGCVGTDPGSAALAGGAAAAAWSPQVVLAHLDTGVNPYHVAFRDASALAYAHPSTYLPGYPADAPALWLSLDEADLGAALKKDRAVWDAVEEGKLYWIPGTRIVGAISLGAGGTNCPPGETPPLTYLSGDCEERLILDDHGHGTMTASRAVGASTSLAPSARLVSVEGPGADAVRWAADQGWIDVQTNSWLGFVPPPASAPVDGVSTAFAYAAERMVTVAASGNGAGYILGFAPTPTYALDTAAPGVVLVGAHDNGFVAPWSGAPAHVLADGYGGWRADRDTRDGVRPHGDACCTSAAAPYAAGGAAALVLEARRLLQSGPGVAEGGILARGEAGLVPAGPLADGDLTVAELRHVLLHTATARPVSGPHDGLLHWAANKTAPTPTDPAGNPYCLGCWSAPVAYADLPEGPALVAHAGYGAVDNVSLALGLSVLRGEAPVPERPEEDAFFATDATIRKALFG